MDLIKYGKISVKRKRDLSFKNLGRKIIFENFVKFFDVEKL